MPKPTPQLPQGNAGIFQGVGENFAFHASPESFITSRVLEFQRTHPQTASSRVPVRAKILNRNVAVISSYDQVKQVLESQSSNENGSPAYVAAEAYSDLMNSFFPPPNLLLCDGRSHRARRPIWESRVEGLPGKLSSFARSTAEEQFKSITAGVDFDLYDSMKTLAWKLLLGAFLDLHPDDVEFATYQRLHEDLLRGQFSLLPVRINLGFWHSPRKVGIDARKQLQVLIAARLAKSSSHSPFAMPDDETLKDVADHTLLFTSSLAVKALASLLTALLLNLYVYRDAASSSLAETIRGTEGAEARKSKIKSVLYETERLSPPIVGIMRRCNSENLISSPGDQPDVVLPVGWDAWLYFVGAGRDPDQFGDTHNLFDPERRLPQQGSSSLAFGAGAKICLGRGIARHFAQIVAEICISMNLNFTSDGLPRGVRGWLGWDGEASPEDWAADMKQLPTQRPSSPVLVKLAATA